jgi:hypothetical protein
MYVKSTLFWDITQRRMVVLYQHFGTTHRSHLQWSKSPFNGADKMSRNVGTEPPLNAAYYQKSADLRKKEGFSDHHAACFGVI